MEQNKMTPTPWKADGCRIVNNRTAFIFGNGAEYDQSCVDAAAIVSAINGTYGVGVNPDAVADLRHALNSLILSVKAHPDYTGEENEEWTDLVEIAEDAMKKAAL